MARIYGIHLTRLLTLILIGLLAAAVIPPSSARAQALSPAYIVLGDSIEFGLGDNIPANGFGYVPLVAASLSSVLGSVEVHNFGVPFAQARDILQTELPGAIAAMQGHAPIVVSWGGGGNDLAEIGTGPQAAACRQSPSCLGRFNGLLNEVEQTIDRTIARLRQAVGPTGRILMRTQYNALAKSGCAVPAVVALGNVTLEGVDGTVLDRGLNDRIRSVAARYHAQVVDLFVPFLLNADALVAADCIHPSGAGHEAIATLSAAAFLSAP